MIRRTYTLPDELPRSEKGGGGQLLVTFDPADGTMHVAHRPDSWDTWSVPFVEDEQLRQDDDAPSFAAQRTYFEGGRRYRDDGAPATLTGEPAYDPQQYVPSASAVDEARAAQADHAAMLAAGIPVASDPPVSDPSGPTSDPRVPGGGGEIDPDVQAAPGPRDEERAARDVVTPEQAAIDPRASAAPMDPDPVPAARPSHEFAPYAANPSICSVCGAVRPMPCYDVAAPEATSAS